MRELRARIINISESGCLIETRRRLEVGTVGTLQLQLGTGEFRDDFEVVRCQAVEGAPVALSRGCALPVDDATPCGIDPSRGCTSCRGAGAARHRCPDVRSQLGGRSSFQTPARETRGRQLDLDSLGWTVAASRRLTRHLTTLRHLPGRMSRPDALFLNNLQLSSGGSGFASISTVSQGAALCAAGLAEANANHASHFVSIRRHVLSSSSQTSSSPARP